MAPRYPLEIDAFFESEGLGCPSARDASVVEAVASSSAPSSDVALLTADIPSDASTVGTSTCGTSEGANLPTLPSEASQKDKVTV